MYAIATITKDLISSDQVNRVFEIGHYSDFHPADIIHQFMLSDDDGITYYLGTLKGDDDGIAEIENVLFDWGLMFAGTALIFVDGELVIG